MTDQSQPTDLKLAARRILCRRIGAAIATAMAETDTSFEQISENLGWSAGLSRSTLLTLLNGRTVTLERLADMASAMNVGISISLQPEYAENV